jgi:enoyl-CoA hydratase
MSKRFRRYYTAQWLEAIWDLEKPVIAQIHGHCVGAALVIVSACDFAIAADDTVFSLPEGRFGGIALGWLPWTVGIRRTKELILLGERFGAVEAERMELINRSVPVGELEAAVAKTAATLAALPPETAYFGKQTINRAFEDAGLRRSIETSYDTNVLSVLTKGGFQEWARVRRQGGAKAALAWRDSAAGKPARNRRPR